MNFWSYRQHYSEIYMEKEKNYNSYSNFEKGQSRKNQSIWFKDLLYTYNHLDCHWWNDRHINQWEGGQNPIIDPNKWYQTDLWQMNKTKSVEEGQPFNKWCWSNWTALSQKKKASKLWIKLHTLYKYHLKIDHGLKSNMLSHKTSRKKYPGENIQARGQVMSS